MSPLEKSAYGILKNWNEFVKSYKNFEYYMYPDTYPKTGL